MKNKSNLVGMFLATVFSFLHPFIYSAASSYDSTHYLIQTGFIAEIAFAVILSICFFYLIKSIDANQSIGVFIAFAVVNLILFWYLYMINAFTFGILPIYHLMTCVIAITSCIHIAISKSRE